ncbi:YwiC-like family protein [Meiothermus sp.]|uniref:YwiC-like family protein n=1 Tax=Meiothermus sp. TaxID=1955249 RepID=UPI002602C53E|nr:YwiC-like family protein [Meiothermus sp.]
MMNTISTPKVSLKAVALPSEHGGWGFTLEPVLLGLLVAPSGAGLGLGLFALAAFFTRHPLKLWLSDLRRGKKFPRTALARNLALLYGLLALAGLTLAAWWASGPFWLPLLLALPLVGVQLWFDAHNRGRNLLPELSGAVAMGAMASSIALAAGQDPRLAYGLWLVLAARAVASIFYARAQVRRTRGESVNLVAAYFAETLAVVVLIAGTGLGLVPWLSVVALAILIPLSLYTFSKPPVPARVVGWSQMALGLWVVLLTALGARGGL